MRLEPVWVAVGVAKQTIRLTPPASLVRPACAIRMPANCPEQTGRSPPLRKTVVHAGRRKVRRARMEAAMSDTVGDDVTGVLEPHEGHVFLDMGSDNHQVLTNVLIMKRYIAPVEGHPFELVFDSGFGMLVSIGSEIVHFLEERFSERVYNVNGELIIFEVVMSDGKEEVQQSSLSDRMREHQCRNYRIILGDDAQDFEVFTVRRPRGSARLMWGVFDMYKYLGLGCYSGQPSKWAYNSFASWDKALSQHGLNGCIIRSWQGLSVEAALKETEHILPRPAIGTMGLLVMRRRWAQKHVRRGGLRDSIGRERSGVLLRGLVAGASIAPFAISLEVTFNWEFAWPRPQPSCEPVLTLKVDRRGLVDVGEWRRLAQENKEYGFQLPAAARVWYAAIEHLVSDNGLVILAEIFLSPQVAEDDRCNSFVGQLARIVGERIEMTYFRSLDMEGCEWPLRCEEVDDEGDWSLRSIDRACTNHVYASRCASKAFKVMGLAIDQFSARALDLCNACFALPDGVAFEALPQAPMWVGGPVGGEAPAGMRYAQ